MLFEKFIAKRSEQKSKQPKKFPESRKKALPARGSEVLGDILEAMGPVLEEPPLCARSPGPERSKDAWAVGKGQRKHVR